MKRQVWLSGHSTVLKVMPPRTTTSKQYTRLTRVETRKPYTLYIRDPANMQFFLNVRIKESVIGA